MARKLTHLITFALLSTMLLGCYFNQKTQNQSNGYENASEASLREPELIDSLYGVWQLDWDEKVIFEFYKDNTLIKSFGDENDIYIDEYKFVSENEIELNIGEGGDEDVVVAEIDIPSEDTLVLEYEGSEGQGEFAVFRKIGEVGDPVENVPENITGVWRMHGNAEIFLEFSFYEVGVAVYRFGQEESLTNQGAMKYRFDEHGDLKLDFCPGETLSPAMPAEDTLVLLENNCNLPRVLYRYGDLGDTKIYDLADTIPGTWSATVITDLEDKSSRYETRTYEFFPDGTLIHSVIEDDGSRYQELLEYRTSGTSEVEFISEDSSVVVEIIILNDTTFVLFSPAGDLGENISYVYYKESN